MMTAPTVTAEAIDLRDRVIDEQNRAAAAAGLDVTFYRDDSDHGPGCDGPYNCTCGAVDYCRLCNEPLGSVDRGHLTDWSRTDSPFEHDAEPGGEYVDPYHPNGLPS